MKKLRLNPDELAVETFDIVMEQRDDDGTVQAHQVSGRFPICATLPDGSGCLTGYTCPECAYTLDPCEDTLICP
jgi:hypothetical protein